MPFLQKSSRGHDRARSFCRGERYHAMIILLCFKYNNNWESFFSCLTLTQCYWCLIGTSQTYLSIKGISIFCLIRILSRKSPQLMPFALFHDNFLFTKDLDEKKARRGLIFHWIIWSYIWTLKKKFLFFSLAWYTFMPLRWVHQEMTRQQLLVYMPLVLK